MKLKRNFEYEEKIAEDIFGYSTKMLDTGFGMSLFLVDLSPKGEKTLAGASWQKARDGDGNTSKYYCRHCPAWSVNLIDAWRLLEYCNRVDSGIDWLQLYNEIEKRVLFGYSPEEAAEDITEAIFHVGVLPDEGEANEKT